MSTPKNHHFVSKTHIKNFFNNKEEKIYVYDKIRKNIFSKTTVNSLFSEKFLNSRYVEDEIDHSSLEHDLNKYFEQDFPRYYDVIVKFIDNRELTEEVGFALFYFAKYGLIGDIRTPRYKNNLDETLLDSFREIFYNHGFELNNEKIKETRFSNIINYSETAENIIDKMGRLIFKIEIPENINDYFLLPDFTAITYREKINEYFDSEIKEIAYIGLPLSSKIYIHFYSEKLFKERKPNSSIIFSNTNNICKHNKVNLEHCQSKIACENKQYLEKFINQNNA